MYIYNLIKFHVYNIHIYLHIIYIEMYHVRMLPKIAIFDMYFIGRFNNINVTHAIKNILYPDVEFEFEIKTDIITFKFVLILIKKETTANNNSKNNIIIINLSPP